MVHLGSDGNLVLQAQLFMCSLRQLQQEETAPWNLHAVGRPLKEETEIPSLGKSLLWIISKHFVGVTSVQFLPPPRILPQAVPALRLFPARSTRTKLQRRLPQALPHVLNHQSHQAVVRKKPSVSAPTPRLCLTLGSISLSQTQTNRWAEKKPQSHLAHPRQIQCTAHLQPQLRVS